MSDENTLRLDGARAERKRWTEKLLHHAMLLERSHAKMGAAELRALVEKMQVCPVCGGNDWEMPCAYPSEGAPGCLRDAVAAVVRGCVTTKSLNWPNMETEGWECNGRAR